MTPYTRYDVGACFVYPSGDVGYSNYNHIDVSYGWKIAGHGWFLLRLASRPFWQRRRQRHHQCLHFLRVHIQSPYTYDGDWPYCIRPSGDGYGNVYDYVDHSYGRKDRRTRLFPSSLAKSTRPVVSTSTAAVSAAIPTG